MSYNQPLIIINEPSDCKNKNWKQIEESLNSHFPFDFLIYKQTQKYSNEVSMSILNSISHLNPLFKLKSEFAEFGNLKRFWVDWWKIP
jgi:hypothetical protein